MKKIGVLFVGFLLIIFTGMANATLMGDTITATGNSLSSGSATIGTGVEFTGISEYPLVSFDFADIPLTTSGSISTLTIKNISPVVSWNSGSEGYFTYIFSDFDEDITDVKLSSNSGFSSNIADGFIVNGPTANGAADHGWTADSITLDLDAGGFFAANGQSYTDAYIVFEITTSPHSNSSAPVPEPATMLLFGFGLLGLAGASRKKQ